ncbi:MAG: DNA polymerase III subunit alpha [Bdellovibrionales bacterium]|nr:DNA polymerase III subunit alpha [Bdellovibrionales bacterium]
MSFVHLHVHSQYSLLEATPRFKELCKMASDNGMPAVAVTDYGNMFGAIEFYFAAQAAKVKPIIGLEVYIAPKGRMIKGEDPEVVKMPNRRLVLLAQNYQGYQNLCKISSIGYQEGFYYRPRVDYETLKQYSDHLIALSGGLVGEVPWQFVNKGEEAALEKIKVFKEIYQDRFYLEMNRTGVEAWDSINPFLIKASKDLGVPLVAANDVHYLHRDEQIAQEVLICIGSNKTLGDSSRYRLGSNEFYFKTPKEMRELFHDMPEVCDRTLEISERCNLEFKLVDDEGKPIYHLPTYPTEAGVSLEEEIGRLAFEGLEVRLKDGQSRGEVYDEEKVKEYKERLDYELKVISNMGFNGYFLIVQDFIRWAKHHDIPVGPGRGSGAGSLVAYCLDITDLDPMPYNLIFERFLNPERISMPDFDIDFCQENRQRVIEYVTQKYGQESVSQIITYGKLQCKAAIRDVGRVMGMTFSEVDVVSKLIPDKLGITIKEAIELEPRLRELMANDPKINSLMELAQKIEGLVRHAGIHAAGVIIADGAIVSHGPLYRGTEGENVVQFDMKHSEKLGLIKFDFLGLKTLTHINDAFKLIEQNRGVKLSGKDISLKDPGIYEILSKGDTNGIFQFESDGITDLIRKAKPDCFEDIVAINALYRPGPMDMIPDYLDRKAGRKKVEYIFAELESIIKETYGIIVYQEHVQLIAAKIANYSLGEADMLRRAMGKKIAEEMAKQKERFLKGAYENKYDPKKAEQLFDMMAEFAKYGFNKSHAAAYCVVSSQTAYLKHYYPVEFFAALLSTEMNDTDKVVKYIKDAQKHGIQVRAPHINSSEYKFTVKGDDIFYSFGAIKGVGKAAVEAIVEAREQLPDKNFESLEQFFEKVDLRRVNKKTVECLIKSGAFDGFGANRAELMDGYSRFIERADSTKKEAELGQVSLFSLDEELMEQEKVVLEKKQPWRRSARLSYEKEVLGFYLSDHPLKGMEKLISFWTTSQIQGLKEKEQKSKVFVAGLISSLREIITKKGTRMAFAQFEDLSGSTELIIFPDAYAKFEMIVKSEGALIVGGSVENDSEQGTSKIIVETVSRLEDQFEKVKKMVFHLDDKDMDTLEKVKNLAGKFPGQTALSIHMELKDIGQRVELNVTEPKGVQASAEFFELLHGALGGTTERIDIQTQ